MSEKTGEQQWRHQNVLDVDNWSKADFEVLLDQSQHMEELMDRPISKVPALRGKMAVNLFFENSTRTRGKNALR